MVMGKKGAVGASDCPPCKGKILEVKVGECARLPLFLMYLSSYYDQPAKR